MKSLFNFLKKFDNLFVFFIFGLSIFFYCFTFELTSIDELWNFQNIYKMYNGFKIYNDCNVIITPLFFVIGEFFFKLLSPNLIAFKIYNLFIFTFLFTFTYILFKTLNLSRNKSLLFSSLILAFLFDDVSGGANYNILSLFFVILGIVFFIKSRTKNIYLLFNGIAIYLAIFTKQNIGIYYLFSICLCELILNKNFFITIKHLIIELIPTIILSIITLLLMYKYNVLNEFMNYAVLGMREFSVKNIFFDWSIIFIFIFILIIYTFSIYIIKKKMINDKTIVNNIIILLTLSMFINLTLYPIFNLYHAKLILVFVIILFLYIIDILILTPLLDAKLYKKLSIIMTICIIVLTFFYTFTIAFLSRNVYYYYDKTHPYYYCYVSDENKTKIKTITEYIESQNSIGIDVIIFSDQAALYMVPLKQSHGYFDLPFIGNFGKDGEDGVIKKIEGLTNTKILIVTNDDDVFWQESKKIREYIINNLTKVGEIEEFSIYEI